MSLQYLGIAHFPVLHRQFSSPTTKASLGSSPSQDVTQDNKDVLIERLNDLLGRLSRNNTLEDTTVTAIHSEVDRIEVLMRGGGIRPESVEVGKRSFSNLRESTDNAEDVFWGPVSPTQSFKMRLPDISASSYRRHIRNKSQIDASRPSALAAAAEDLASQLTATVAELQIRKEESDHIHDLIVMRAERAAERILLLENRTAEMTEGFEANQSELKFLRIQLQAIEAQFSQCSPRHEDEELSQSIINWKVDWEDIDRRSKARKKKSHVSVEIYSDSQIVAKDT